MQDNYITLISLLLPEGILEYFDITDGATTKEGLSIYLEEKNTPLMAIHLTSYNPKDSMQR